MFTVRKVTFGPLSKWEVVAPSGRVYDDFDNQGDAVALAREVNSKATWKANPPRKVD